ncbi:sigma-70 family RNA polymerase sigma factor [Ktedonosporobacter rubrisoli]|uniref:Sigma-70 family RNA polymerase sigma factor n=1 Tax=Ktedonosporobacter rubrisoli TaxID=2509675 RepID=A0A4P6JSI6_KTERU|nr:sigma-70 family RNA polymerase sigma factor [Ktedonosporobacter rubrisoli]QBD78499.1 sigma-70 family RNA polymerase sigma factor [Ktedonosporobacter rubrisoli]
MDEHDWLAAQFEAQRPHLRAVAYRMLGSLPEAEDAVQEGWLHLSRSETIGIGNLHGWLTTVVARICLDMLRSRKARREEPGGLVVPEPDVDPQGRIDPAEEMELSDSVGQALLIVLDTLSPAERLAFVLHDVFAVPFNEIAPIVGCSELAARKLASRARNRVRKATMRKEADDTRSREVVDAFLKASRDGDFDTLLTLLDPDVVLRADRTAVSIGAPGEVHGARAVASQFSGRARGVKPALVNGAVGAMAQRGQRFLVFSLTIKSGKIAEINVVADPEHLRHLDLVILGSSRTDSNS